MNLHHFSRKALPDPKIGTKKVVYVSLMFHWRFSKLPAFIPIQSKGTAYSTAPTLDVYNMAGPSFSPLEQYTMWKSGY